MSSTMCSAIKEKLIEVGEQILQLRRLNQLEIVTKKNYADLQTAGDRQSEEMLVAFLKRMGFTRIRGEEGTVISNDDSDLEWVLDPIDGTLPYASGRSNFSISMGLLQRGKPVEGYLYFPALKTFIWGSMGFAVTKLDGQDIYYKDRETDLKNSIIGFDFSSGADRQKELRQYVMPLCNKVKSIYMEGSITGALLEILEDRFDAYVSPGATPFDLAASTIIAKEAGLTVKQIGTDNPIDFNREQTPVIFSNSRQLAEEIEILVTH